MPLPSVLCLALSTGLAAALAARNEIRLSPRHPLLTRAFSALTIFLGLVLVPISVYFYLFHGDWFLLYLWDVREVPSAVALLGFVVEFVLGVAGFALGATLVRSQRDLVVALAALAALLTALAPAGLAGNRLSLVGSYAQFHGGFGLARFDEGAMLHGAALMGVIFLVGLTFTLVRVWSASRRLT